VTAMVAGQFAIAAANRMVMGKDDKDEDRYDKLSKFDTYNNFLLAIPGVEDPIKFHIPRQFAWLNVAAVAGEKFSRGSITAEEFASDLFTSIVGTGSPLDVTSGTVAGALTPTFAQPLEHAATNTDSFGKPLNPPYPDEKRPPSEQAFRTVNPHAQQVARAINEITGGDEVTPGAVSIKPGTVKDTFDWATGGTGQFAARLVDVVEKVVSGKADRLKPNDIPLVRKMITGEDKHHQSSEYYEATKEIASLTTRVKEYRERGQAEKATAAIEANSSLWKLRLMSQAVEKRVKAMRDRLKVLPKDSPDRDTIEDNIEELMARFNAAVRKSK